MKKKIVSIFIVMLFLVLAGCGCKQQAANYGLVLEVWGVMDESDAYANIFENYMDINPAVKSINFRKFSSDTYKKELIEALASGKGPDIFMINSSWTPSFLNKIVEAPATVISEKKFRSDFVDVAADSFMKDGKIYAVPLSVDSLALYYNKDLFNEAGITSPPATWDDLKNYAARLTKVDGNGNITQSGAALGTAYNINRSTDILGLMMIQKKAEMTKSNGKVSFNEIVSNGNVATFPGMEALDFYTQFARVNSPYYTWNPSLHYSLDAFSEGSVAMMLNYSWNMETIRRKSPKINFAIAPVPQFPNGPKASFANCWGYVVAQNKIPVAAPGFNSAVSNEIRTFEAWKFLKYFATKPDGQLVAADQQLGTKAVDPNFDPAKIYLEKTKKPAARKDIIEIQKNSNDLGVFAEQGLVAKSWTQIDPDATEAILAEVIDQVNKGKFEPREAISVAASRINKIIGD